MAPDVGLHVRHWPGGDAAFVLVHGLASNARMWDGVAERLSGAGHTVAAVDQRGHGQSDKPDHGYDFATLTNDLIAVVDALEMDRAIAVGQSWGANVVLEFAHRHPERAQGVACIDGGTNDMVRRFPVWEDAAATLAPPVLSGTPLERIEAFMRQAHGDWPEQGIQGALANFEVRSDGTVAPWLSRPRHMVILRELWGHRPSQVQTKLAVPLLVIVARDHAADHDIHAQKPDVVAGLLLDALTDGCFS